MDSNELKKSLLTVFKRNTVPEKETLMVKLENAVKILSGEPEKIRPRNNKGLSGGLIYLSDLPSVIIPDLHGRVNFLLSLLSTKIKGKTILEKLDNNEIQIICLGDAMHGERRVYERWINALEEFNSDYKSHSFMDEEINESFSVLETAVDLKTAYPDRFHFLKGNHENIKNEEGEGNHQFRKFAHEGEMIKTYVEKFYGTDFLNTLYQYEKLLPLFAVGKNFLVSHAEPGTFYDRETIINSSSNPDLIHDLTWTANDEAEEGSVERMLEYYLGSSKDLFYFGGHRINYDLYNLRAEGRFIQINNPSEYAAAFIEDGKNFIPDSDIVFLDKNIDIEKVLLN